MYFRCELLVGGGAYDVTEHLVNWDDVEMSFKRNDYDGVVRSFSTKYRFANGAYTLIMGEYFSNYLQASASIVFYTRNNSWLWEELFRCALDYSTLTEDGTTCEINAVDDSLAALLKSKRSVTYEFPVDEVKYEKQLYYDRVKMKSVCSWTDGGTLSDDGSYSDIEIPEFDKVVVFPVYITTSEIAIPNQVEVADAAQAAFDPSDYGSMEPFVRAMTSITILLECSMTVNFSGSGVMEWIRFTVGLYVIRNGAIRFETVLSQKEVEGGGREYSYSGSMELAKGEKLVLWYDVAENSLLSETTFRVYDFSLDISFDAVADPVYIDIVKPVTLLNALLKSINDDRDGIVGKIEEGVDERLDNAYLAAAESIRGLSEAKFYTSYNKFCDWMSAAFGFVPYIEDDSVTFVHRNKLFTDNAVKDLAEAVTDFEFSVESGLIHASVKSGYDKQDYDSVNGLDEFNFTNEYATGVTLTDSTLELISPYRADCYGFEFLALKRGEDTTDSDSDKDVFFVGCVEEARITVMRSPDITGSLNRDTVFNQAYSPRSFIEANKRFLAAFSERLEFASSDGNSGVVIGGVAENADVELSEALFTVGEVKATTGDLDVPEDLTGYVTLEKNGRKYEGYIQSVGYMYGRPAAVEYELIVKSIE